MYKILFITLTVLIQACAFTDATLPVHHDSTIKTIGPISELETLSFTSPELQDNRPDKNRIGWKKNGYGMNTADITTKDPVQTIITRALTDAIKNNGHAISTNPSITITGDVDRFWFETDQNFWTIEFLGDIQCTLNFIDTVTKETIYTSTYTGTHKKKVAGGLERTWTEVMGKAVDNLIEDVIFDEDLAEALEDHNQK